MKQLFAHLRASLPFLAVLLVLPWCPPLAGFATCNALLQAGLFLFIVMIPVARTERMGYVDLGWPLGLAMIGALTLYFGDSAHPRTWLIASLYLIAGGRMSLMALLAWHYGHLDRELPRYQYQRLRWQRRGWRARPAMLFEVASQGLANMSVLALPALLMAANTTTPLTRYEFACALLWLAAFAFECLADAQKLRFQGRMRAAGRRGAHCQEGLWRYSRHPNYFGEWMTWNALLLLALPSLWQLAAQLPLWQLLVLGLGLIEISWVMYVVLNHYSGAVPAEYYSVQKRPGYAEYQRTTSRFFPRPPKAPAVPA